MRIFISLVITFFLFSGSVSAQDIHQHRHELENVADTTTQETNNAIPQPDDEFNLFLFALAAGAACFIAGFFFLGICAALLFIAILLMLISLGIVSTSAFIGWQKRSLSTGFKTFWLLLGAIVGGFFGFFSLQVISFLFKLHLSQASISFYGISVGIITGGFVGFTIFYIIKKGFKFLAIKFGEIRNKLNS